MLLRGAARTDEGPFGHREATGNAGDSPANRDKDRTKEKALAVDGPDDIYNAYYKEVNKGLANQIADLWRAGDPNVTQINWNAMYSANYTNNAINPNGYRFF